MAVDSKHPLYSASIHDWHTCRHTYRGERVVKDQDTLYLPPTPGMVLDGMTGKQPGRAAYDSYKTRAVFPDVVSNAVETMIGLMWNKPPKIELPKIMEPLLERATIRGESLQQLLRRINEQQLVTGRMGLLLDMPSVPTQDQVLPYIATYHAEDIINWDEGARGQVVVDSLNLVVLDESQQVRQNNFDWKSVKKYRVLILGDVQENESSGPYQYAVFDEGNLTFNPAALQAPTIRGKTLDQIPFVFINSKDITPTPDDPPLLGLARLALAIYRGEADYRQCLFLQGQDTLVVMGNQQEEAVRVGAGARLDLPLGGDAKFIGVNAAGLSEQRQCLENDKAQAQEKSGQLFSNVTNQKESGEALKTRISAQTATLNQIALSGAGGLQSILRIMAKWIGADPEQVIVTPNLDFANKELLGDELVKFVTAKNMGAPISQETIHNLMKKRDITTFTFEEELDKISEEEPLLVGGTEAGGNPEDENDEPEDE